MFAEILEYVQINNAAQIRKLPQILTVRLKFTILILSFLAGFVFVVKYVVPKNLITEIAGTSIRHLP